ncbi:HEPN domain-containing protein [Flagellimonas alvinocaridis]|uniref:HEPN domain-containing protein n=1 Tax=Flagellimonas alvinocaridis TaxID=2530200 RepID=A0A4S8RVM1_9FLAO|nr:HEPN domain-containing protein [Allomuricauda alvinocaridis]THV61295.1 HEPN domain-containing protein [Allomuricauda alvinocaridis]
MEHYLNIPKNFDKKEELSNLIDNILNVITIDAIFLSMEQREGESPYHILTFFADVNNNPIPNEILGFGTKTAKDHPDFRIKIYTEEQSEIGILRGSLYFLEHCCLGEMVYAHPEGTNLLDYPELAMGNILKRAERYFDLEMKKIKAFVNTAEILLKEGDHAIAAFNLHQAFELAFRFMEQMFIGHSKVTHSIISHINFCKDYFPTLRPFPKTAEMDNNELLLLLEHAYSAARYGNEYEINKGQVQLIQSEFQSFAEQVETIFNRHLEDCRQRIHGDDDDKPAQIFNEVETHIEEQVTIMDEPVDIVLQETVSLIKKKLNPTHIYLMQKRTLQTQDKVHFLRALDVQTCPVHYWLFIVSDKTNIDPIHSVVDTIQQKFQQVSLCICSDAPKVFSKKLNNGNPFYKKVVRSGKLLFQGEGAMDLRTNDDLPKMGTKKTRKTISSRYRRARNYLVVAESPMGDSLMAVHFVSLAVEQACLGLIYGVLKYRPRNHSLSHLIKLCGHLYPKIHDYFPMHTELDKDLFQLLRNASSKMRYQNRDVEIDEIKADILLQRSREFMVDSRAFVQAGQ